MGKIFDFEKNKLICAVTFGAEADLDEGLEALQKAFGETDFVGGIHSFDFTSYYEGEMGAGLKKVLVAFENLVDAGDLALLKVKSNELEDGFAVDGNRLFNFDVGILDEGRLILASTKRKGHRIPLSYGIYGEVTLLFVNGGFSELSWTYSDFKSDVFKDELIVIRKKFLQDRKKCKEGS